MTVRFLPESGYPMRPLRVISVPYLNAAPLTWGFEHGEYRDRVSLSHEPPSHIAELLRTGHADIGLVPSIDYQRLEGVEILPSLCVASKRRARSVFLASRRPIEEIASIALDENSSASVALLRLLLAHRGRSSVVFNPQTPSLSAMLRENDAALIIGDAALTADTAGLRVYDLAAEWFAITRLPFVFAIWVARREAVLPEGVRPFVESLRAGQAHIETIADNAFRTLGLPRETLVDYLKINIHYQLGPDELRALDLFYRQAGELGLVAARRPIRLRDREEGHERAAGMVTS